MRYSDGNDLKTNASAIVHLDINDDPDADRASRRKASPARAVVCRIPMRRSRICFPQGLLLRPTLPSTDLTTALLTEIESRAISIDAGRAAPATAVTARFGVIRLAIRIRTQLLLATTLALEERTAGATVRADLIAGYGCNVCTQ